MKKIIIANWKMNPSGLREAVRIVRETERGLKRIKGVEVVIAPPFPFLSLFSGLKTQTSGFQLGAQDVFWENQGSYTGEVSAAQLRSLGVKYIIVGHSERRALGEDNEIVGKKLKAVLSEGLKAILCVGEEERRKDVAFPLVVREELKSAVIRVPKKHLEGLVVAYEPIWAIGTGKADTPKNVFEMSTLIRRELYTLLGKGVSKRVPIIYGGSVNDRNAADFVKEGRVDGLLVGGAGLNPKKFAGIVKKIAEI